jgi:hypothetical protein
MGQIERLLIEELGIEIMLKVCVRFGRPGCRTFRGLARARNGATRGVKILHKVVASENYSVVGSPDEARRPTRLSTAPSRQATTAQNAPSESEQDPPGVTLLQAGE